MNFLLKFFLIISCCLCCFSLISSQNNNYETIIPSSISEPNITLTLSENPTKCVQNPKIFTFMYHYIREDDPSDTPIIASLSVSPKNFKAHMATIRQLANEKKFTLMTGENFEKAFLENCFPSDKIWIFTSDDGWVDNAEKLAPLATEFQIPFIFGIIAETINKK